MKKILFLLSLLTSCIFSQEVISTDRPGQGENPETLTPRRIQGEAGIGIKHFSFIYGGLPISPENTYFSGLLLRYGVSPDWELRFVGNASVYSFYQDTSYTEAGPWELGTKIRLFNKENSSLLLSYLFHWTASSDFRTFGALNKILLAWQFAGKWSLYAYAGYRHTYPNLNAGMYMLNLVFQPWKKFSFYAQIYDNGLFLDDGTDLLFNPEAGGTFLIADNLQLDYSFGYDYSFLSEGPYGSLGLSFYPRKR